MTDILCIGEMVIDFFPGAEEGSFITMPSGAPAVVAVAAVKNGFRAGMATKVGNDDFGRLALKLLTDNDVAVLSPKMCDEAMTTLAFVTLDKNGERSITFARKPGADMFLAEDDIREEDLQNITILHAGSFALSGGLSKETTVHTLRKAHEMGKLISFDINYRDIVWNGDMEACGREVKKALPYIDLLKASEEEMEMLGGEEAITALMKENGITAIVETLGGKGARCFFGDSSFFSPSYEAKKVVDTTGAGDSFWGAFLSQLLHHGVTNKNEITEEILIDAVDYGNVSGFFCVQTKGAIPSLATREQIEAFRANHS